MLSPAVVNTITQARAPFTRCLYILKSSFICSILIVQFLRQVNQLLRLLRCAQVIVQSSVSQLLTTGSEGSLNQGHGCFRYLADICIAVGWATPRTFARFYNLRMECQFFDSEDWQGVELAHSASPRYRWYMHSFSPVRLILMNYGLPFHHFSTSPSEVRQLLRMLKSKVLGVGRLQGGEMYLFVTSWLISICTPVDL